MATLDTATSADFKARYPAFTGTDDGLIDVVMTEARGSVSTRWIEADQVPALLALTAHLLVMAQYNTGTYTLPDGSQIAVTGPVEETKVGDVGVKFAQRKQSDKAEGGTWESELGATTYGRLFLQLRRRSFSGPLVISSPVAWPGMLA